MKPTLLLLLFLLVSLTACKWGARFDTDEDGYTIEDGDCNDEDAAINRDATEVCDGVDNDCDGVVDRDAGDAFTVYNDADGDTYGDDATAERVCLAPPDTVQVGGDCDDSASGVHPGALELCNQVDEDCDGNVSDGASPARWWLDADQDEYGDDLVYADGCNGATEGWVNRGGDCDDRDARINDGADELCDGLDNDCDDIVDQFEGDTVTGYADADGDTYGDPATTTTSCPLEPGFVPDAGDCYDHSSAFHPGAAEADCDDPNDYNCDGSVRYTDRDRDGFPACSECDDGQVSVHPDAIESCDGIDNDCDGRVDNDDAIDALTWYADTDDDGFGDAAVRTLACAPPPGFVADDTDCDDTHAFANPNGVDLFCDDIDADCSGSDGDLAVDDDGATWPDAYSTLQEAIEAASAGALVCVAPGTYHERISIEGKELQLVALACEGGSESADCREDTTIDADDAGTVVTFDGQNGAITSASRLSGFTLTGGMNTLAGGVFLRYASPLLDQLIVTDNLASNGSATTQGGGLLVIDGDLDLSDSLITRNTVVAEGAALAQGGGLYQRSSTGAHTLRLNNVTFSENLAESPGGTTQGGGIYAYNLSNATFGDLTLSENIASGASASGGGAFLASVASASWAGGGTADLVSGNSAASYGGGVLIDNASDFAISDVTFGTLGAPNTAQTGGGLLLGASVVTLTDVAFTGNQATGVGGGLYQYVGGHYTFDACSFADNTANGAGAGAYMTTYGGGTSLDAGFTGTTFDRNQSRSDLSGGCGAALYVWELDSAHTVDLSISDSSFQNNDYLPGGSGTSGQAGALCFVGDTLTLSDTSFTTNTAQSPGNSGGGAVRLTATTGATLDGLTFTDNSDLVGGGGMAYVAGSGPATLSNSSFDNNSAGVVGSAISAFAPMTISDTTFTGNEVSSADEGGEGGAIQLSDSSAAFVLDRLTFADNVSSAYGGAILINGAGSVSITDSSFTGNLAALQGGAVYSQQDSVLTITGTTFTGNVSGSLGGAVGVVSASAVEITDCTFEANSTVSAGAAINCYADLTVTNTTFTSNTTGTVGRNDAGGAIYMTQFSGVIPDLTITGSSFDGNTNIHNGAVYWELADVVSISDTSFTNNTAGYRGAAVYGVAATSVALSGVTVTGNQTLGVDAGAPVHLYNTDSVDIDESFFSSNVSNRGDGALSLQAVETITVQNTEFLNNTSVSSSGAMSLGGATGVTQTATLHNVAFVGNTSTAGNGGALRADDSGSNADIDLRITNAIFADNTAQARGGGIYLADRAELTLTNATLIGNSGDEGGALFVGANVSYPSSATLNNVSLEDNTCDYSTTCGPAVYLISGTFDATYSHATGNSGSGGSLQFGSDFGDLNDADFAAGTGNLVGSLPMFSSTTYSDPATFLTLQAGSPLIDVGDPSLYDADGTRSDIGAHGGPGSGSW